MYRRVLLILLVSLLSSLSFASDPARVEVFGGFQYFRANSGFDVSAAENFNLNGWNASLTGYFNRYLGLTADFSGAYGSPEFLGVPIHTKYHTFMVGPVFRLANPSPFTPYVHALAGGARLNGEVSGSSASETDAAWAVGGGLDLDMGRFLSLRLGQIDYLQSRVSSTTQNNIRYSGGVVIKF